MTMREVLKGYEGGFQIGVRRVTNLRYAYDLAGLLRNTVTTVDVSTWKSEQKVWTFDKCWKDKGHGNSWDIQL